jgi:predicted Zn-dependent protease
MFVDCDREADTRRRRTGPLVRGLPPIVMLLLAQLAAPALRSEAGLPDIGDSAGAIVSPEQERRMGEAFLREAHQLAKIVDDPEIESYFSGLGQQLAAHTEGYGGGFTFFLIDADPINAFAAPGGYIGAHTGTVLSSRTESELAAVIAHEISHVTQRHAARSFEAASKMSLPMAAAMLGAILVAATNPDAGAAAITAVQAGAQQYQLNFTRANEQEADRIGIQLMHRAGFDADAMATFFERLQLANRFTDPKHLPEYLRSHPVSVNRAAEARERARALPRQDHVDSASYHLVKAKLRVLVADDAGREVLDAERSLRDREFENESVARYRYALALATVREFDQARAQLQHLLAEDPEQSAYLLALGQLETRAGNTAGGLEYFEKVMDLYPGYRPAAIGYIEALIAEGLIDHARQALNEYAFDHARDLRYYKLLAEVEGRGGLEVESHIALAEYHFRLGDGMRALQHLEYAQRTPDLDYYQRERISARVDEIKRDLGDPTERRRR